MFRCVQLLVEAKSFVVSSFALAFFQSGRRAIALLLVYLSKELFCFFFGLDKTLEDSEQRRSIQGCLPFDPFLDAFWDPSL